LFSPCREHSRDEFQGLAHCRDCHPHNLIGIKTGLHHLGSIHPRPERLPLHLNVRHPRYRAYPGMPDGTAHPKTRDLIRQHAIQRTSTKERIICRWQFTNLQVPLEELSIHIFLSRGDTGHVISKLHSSFASLFPSLPPSRDARGVMEGTTHQMHLLEEQNGLPFKSSHYYA
jgi:hypothetical protein